MYLNPVGLRARLLASLQRYGALSDGKSGQARGRNGTDQDDPWDLFSLYIILVIFQIISSEEKYQKD